MQDDHQDHQPTTESGDSGEPVAAEAAEPEAPEPTSEAPKAERVTATSRAKGEYSWNDVAGFVSASIFLNDLGRIRASNAGAAGARSHSLILGCVGLSPDDEIGTLDIVKRYCPSGGIITDLDVLFGMIEAMHDGSFGMRDAMKFGVELTALESTQTKSFVMVLNEIALAVDQTIHEGYQVTYRANRQVMDVAEEMTDLMDKLAHMTHYDGVFAPTVVATRGFLETLPDVG